MASSVTTDVNVKMVLMETISGLVGSGLSDTGKMGHKTVIHLENRRSVFLCPAWVSSAFRNAGREEMGGTPSCMEQGETIASLGR